MISHEFLIVCEFMWNYIYEIYDNVDHDDIGNVDDIAIGDYGIDSMIGY